MFNLKRIFLLFVILSFFLIIGCTKQKQEIYVPSKWTTTEYIKEIRAVWFINSKDINFDNIPEMRKVVARIWEADRDGKTQEEIEKAFKTRRLKDIILNGI